MTPPHTDRYTTRVLALGLAIALWTVSNTPLRAQPLSSGIGVGTGTGLSGGERNTTGTGLESGRGNMSGTGRESGSSLILPGANNYINPSRGRNLISPGRVR